MAEQEERVGWFRVENGTTQSFRLPLAEVWADRLAKKAWTRVVGPDDPAEWDPDAPLPVVTGHERAEDYTDRVGQRQPGNRRGGVPPVSPVTSPEGAAGTGTGVPAVTEDGSGGAALPGIVHADHTPTDPGPPPAQNAAKADWVAYAVRSGADPIEAERSTKADLIDRYGAA